MTFNKIDMQTWCRSESFSHYFNDVPCTYSMTVNLDATNFVNELKRTKTNFFPAFLYGISHIVNRYKEFRMDMDEEKNLGFYSSSNPCYTVFNSETETITNILTEYNANFNIFMQNYKNDMLQYKNQRTKSKISSSKNFFNVSCIPWTSFTGFNLNLQQGYEYFPPIFTIGKYFSENDKISLPLAIQVHHAVCDGFHISRFVNDLQDWLDKFFQ